jgi:hypothetical protein
MQQSRTSGVSAEIQVSSSRASSIAFFVALLASALMLGPALAHAFELPAKIGLPREEYFIVQQIYRGWAGFGAVLIVQVVALLTAAFVVQRDRRVLIPTVLALLFVLGAQVLFWAYTYPANVATANWTVQTDDWMHLRRMWEYSHLAGTGLQVLGMACLIVAVMSRPAGRKRTDRTC